METLHLQSIISYHSDEFSSAENVLVKILPIRFLVIFTSFKIIGSKNGTQFGFRISR
jgi:hypothetical protein